MHVYLIKFFKGHLQLALASLEKHEDLHFKEILAISILILL